MKQLESVFNANQQVDVLPESFRPYAHYTIIITGFAEETTISTMVQHFKENGGHIDEVSIMDLIFFMCRKFFR